MPPPTGVRPPELFDLRRVFNHLASHISRTTLRRRLLHKTDKLLNLQSFIESNGNNVESLTGAVDVFDVGDGSTVTKYQAPIYMKNLNESILLDKASEKQLQTDPLKHISVRDLDAALKGLGRTCSKKEVEYMIWECDDDLDSCINWEEFQVMFNRNTSDVSGLEPFELFNIVQFMTYDEDFKGHITEDDTMSTLFARHGRENLELQMLKLFGDQLKSNGGEGILTLEQYLRAVSVRQVKVKNIEYTVVTESMTKSVNVAGAAGVGATLSTTM